MKKSKPYDGPVPLLRHQTRETLVGALDTVRDRLEALNTKLAEITDDVVWKRVTLKAANDRLKRLGGIDKLHTFDLLTELEMTTVYEEEGGGTDPRRR